MAENFIGEGVFDAGEGFGAEGGAVSGIGAEGIAGGDGGMRFRKMLEPSVIEIMLWDMYGYREED